MKVNEKVVISVMN